MLVPDPLSKVLRRIINFPEYSELEPEEKTEEHGDLEAWEGTNCRALNGCERIIEIWKT